MSPGTTLNPQKPVDIFTLSETFLNTTMASNRSRTLTPTAFDVFDSLEKMLILDMLLSSKIWQQTPKAGLHSHGLKVAPYTGLTTITTSPRCLCYFHHWHLTKELHINLNVYTFGISTNLFQPWCTPTPALAIKSECLAAIVWLGCNVPVTRTIHHTYDSFRPGSTCDLCTNGRP